MRQEITNYWLILKSDRHIQRTSIVILFLVILLPIIILLSFSQTRFNSKADEIPTAEAENGINKTSQVTLGTDSEASGGQYIEFSGETAFPPINHTRPIFGTYAETTKFPNNAAATNIILQNAKIVYSEAMNWCGPDNWSDPQSIINQPAGRYNMHPTFIAKINNVYRNPEVLKRGIIARGYVHDSEKGQDPRPTSLPSDVSNPLFEEAMKRVEVECTKSIITSFKDRITNWRINNEMFDGNGRRYNSWFTNRPVDIRHKITAAKEADPNAKIFIDDYGNDEINNKSTGMLNYMEELRQQGYAMDGIGFQGHYSLKYPPNYTSIRQNIQRFKDVGFDVAFTEVDVAIDGASGSEDEKRQRQKDIFKNTAQICKDFSNCTLYMLFGMDDNASWLGDTAKATPFDINFQSKPAYTALKEVFGL